MEEVEVKEPEPVEEAPKKTEAEIAAETAVSQKAEEEKLMRKAKKKLNEIETLEKRGPPYTPEEEAKVNRKGEFLAEITYLEKKAKAGPKEQPAAKSKANKAAPQKEQPAAKSKPNKAEAPA